MRYELIVSKDHFETNFLELLEIYIYFMIIYSAIRNLYDSKMYN